MRFNDQESAGYAMVVWMRTGDSPTSMRFPIEEPDELSAMATAHDYVQRHKGHLSVAGLEVRAEVWALHNIDGEASTGDPEQFVGAWLLSRHGSAMEVHATQEYVPPTDIWRAARE